MLKITTSVKAFLYKGASNLYKRIIWVKPYCLVIQIYQYFIREKKKSSLWKLIENPWKNKIVQMVLFLDISLLKIFVCICQEYFKVEKWTIWTICSFYKKWSFFFMKQYMRHTVLSLNEVYQIYLNKTMKKQNSFCKKVIENPWKDNVVQIIFHTLDLNLLKVLSK